MRASLAGLCSLFIENRDVIKSTFIWDSTYMYPVCAYIITDKGIRADEGRLRRCKELLNERTGFFSNFRGTAKLAMIAMTSVDGNPVEKLNSALQVYDDLKEHFMSSQYLPVASMLIADMSEPYRYREIAARTRRIYELMKSRHPFLTSSEDSVYAAMLAMSEKNDESIVAEVESCYRLLKREFSSGNAVQSLSHVLALCEGSAEDKCRAAMELFRELKASGHKYGTGYELATLGVLAMLPAELETIIRDIAEADSFLAAQKGYGFFGPGKKQRLMHAGMLVTSDYMKDNRAMQGAAVHGTIALIAAQQSAICAAIAASGAAAASGSNSGG